MGWFAPSAARVVPPAALAMLDAAACAALCELEGEGNCTAWSLLPLPTESSAACVLDGPCDGNASPRRLADVRSVAPSVTSGFAAWTGRCAAAEVDAVAMETALPNAYNESSGECVPEAPRCREPETAGTFTRGTFVPDEDCFFHQFTPEQVVQCLAEPAQDHEASGSVGSTPTDESSGSSPGVGAASGWVVVAGGSNAILFFNTLANYLAPGSLDIGRDGVATGKATVIDVVFDGATGAATYVFNEFWGMSFAFMGDLEEGAGLFDEAFEARLDEALARAPAPAASGRSLRVTLVVGQYWQNAEVVLRAATEGPRVAAGPWARSRRLFYAQIMQWYSVCGTGYFLCNREDLMGEGEGHAIRAMESELEAFLRYARAACRRPTSLGCFVAPNVYDPNQRQSLRRYVDSAAGTFAAFRARYAGAEPEGASSAASPGELGVGRVHFLDVYELGAQLASEVSEAHVMPVVSLWYLHIMLNVACDEPATQEGDEATAAARWSGMRSVPLRDVACHESASYSSSCFFADTRYDQCSTYRSHCGSDCKLWECANTRDVPCSVDVTVPTFDPLTGRQLDLSRAIEVPALWRPPDDATSAHRGARSCKRVWCGTRADGEHLAWWTAALALSVVLASAARARGWCGAQCVNASAGPSTQRGTEEAPGHSPNGAAAASGPGAATDAPSDEEAGGACGRSGGAARSPTTADEAAARTVPDAPDAPKPRAERLHALGAARFLASLHIVVGHLSRPRGSEGLHMLPPSYFGGWGFTWVPWFFMLSGYVLAHARLGSPNPDRVDGPLRSIWKRSASIYPMYAVGLLLSALVRIGADRELPKAGYLVPQAFLVQSWLPWLTEQGLASHCWFLSCMVVYWAAFGTLYALILRMSARWTLGVLVACAALPWLAVVAPAIARDEDWYRYRSGDTGSTDLVVVALKFNPLAYLHVFVFGMALAKLRSTVGVYGESRGAQDVPPQKHRWARRALAAACTYGAVLGYGGLLLVFCVRGLRPYSAKLSARLSVLMPLQGLILIGLSSPADPIALAFARGPLPALADVSYVQYVIQFVAADIWPVETGVGLSFFVFLAAASKIGHWAVQEPGRRLWSKYWALAVATPCVVAVLLVSVYAGVQGPARAAAGKRPPAFVAYFDPESEWALSGCRRDACSSFGNDCCAPDDEPATCRGGLVARKTGNGCWWFADGDYECCAQSPVLQALAEGLEEWPEMAGREVSAFEGGGMIDARLDFTCAGCGMNGTAVMNPSLAIVGDALVVTARAHAMYEVRTKAMHNGTELVEDVTVWHSEIVTATTTNFDLGTFDPTRWALPTELAAMRMATSLSGPPAWEPCAAQARYVPENNTLRSTRVTGPEDPKVLAAPLPAGGSSPSGALVLFNSLPPPELAADGGRGCGEPGKNELAVSQMFVAQYPVSASSPVPAPVPAPAVAVRMQCGWTRLHEKNWIAFEHGGQLNAVYSVHPHRVVQIRAADGACRERWSTTHAPLATLKYDRPDVQIHGSGTAHRDPRSPDGDFIALFHTVDGAGTYATFLYRFAPAPPYAIIRVSRPLPLWGNHSFASGLLLTANAAVVTYGVDNAESRLLMISLSAMDELFAEGDAWLGTTDRAASEEDRRDENEEDERQQVQEKEDEHNDGAGAIGEGGGDTGEEAATFGGEALEANPCNMCGALGPLARCAGCAAGAPPPPPPLLEDVRCRRDACASYGDDCCAPGDEPKTCLYGLVARVTGLGCWFYADGDYECCEPEPERMDCSGCEECIEAPLACYDETGGRGDDGDGGCAVCTEGILSACASCVGACLHPLRDELFLTEACATCHERCTECVVERDCYGALELRRALVVGAAEGEGGR